MMMIILNVICFISAFYCHKLAKSRGANPVLWVVLGFVFGPLAIPFIFLSKPATETTEKNDNNMEDDNNNLPHLKQKKGIYWGLWLRAVMAIYVITLPSCVKDASHFGPGFGPLIASFLLVPIFGSIAFADAIKLYVEIIQRKNLRKKF